MRIEMAVLATLAASTAVHATAADERMVTRYNDTLAEYRQLMAAGNDAMRRAKDSSESIEWCVAMHNAIDYFTRAEIPMSDMVDLDIRLRRDASSDRAQLDKNHGDLLTIRNAVRARCR